MRQQIRKTPHVEEKNLIEELRKQLPERTVRTIREYVPYPFPEPYYNRYNKPIWIATTSGDAGN